MSADVAVPFPGILAIFNNVASGREAEFEEWFQHEHLAERLAVPGFLMGRRHEVVRASSPPSRRNSSIARFIALRSTRFIGRAPKPSVRRPIWGRQAWWHCRARHWAVAIVG
jgi:hypothetical protein